MKRILNIFTVLMVLVLCLCCTIAFADEAQNPTEKNIVVTTESDQTAWDIVQMPAQEVEEGTTLTETENPQDVVAVEESAVISEELTSQRNAKNNAILIGGIAAIAAICVLIVVLMKRKMLPKHT